MRAHTQRERMRERNGEKTAHTFSGRQTQNQRLGGEEESGTKDEDLAEQIQQIGVLNGPKALAAGQLLGEI